MLYPITNAHRTVLCLNGIWDFQRVANDYLPQRPLAAPMLIGVPASYNELFTEAAIRDHVGRVCYETTVALPAVFQAGETRLRIGAAGNRAEVYVDGELLAVHNGGFLPIDLEIPVRIVARSQFRLSVVLDNRLDFTTLPIGEVVGGKGAEKQRINHDFANETGIHRDVLVYCLPLRPIRDITIRTKGHADQATIDYVIECEADDVGVTLKDPQGIVVAAGRGKTEALTIQSAQIWDIGRGNLYTLCVQTDTDAYEQRFGIRDVEVTADGFLLNGRPVYFRGFGMHEDHVTVGKGNFAALNVRDFALLTWINANSFRTSHYPYAESMYDLADRLGILVIDEIPAVGLNFWSPRPVFVKGTVDDKTLSTHLAQLSELVARDKNHPSVVMISVANEAASQEEGATAYFEQIFRHVRALTDRPLMIIETVGADVNKVAQFADVIGLNRYIGWYTDFADLDIVRDHLRAELSQYHERFGKPVMLTEFGADTIAGLHRLPAVAFSEEFQVEFLETYHDAIRDLPFMIGEHVWNFADFLTKQGLTRFDGNKKGVFTRDRQPKMAAHWLKSAWRER
ncbi:MAG: beta-glucuronidase [bacterium]